MITSIIKLPSFDGSSAKGSAYIDGLNSRCAVFTDEVYCETGVPPSGRAFAINPVWRKYKLRCMCCENKFFDIVCCADGDIDLRRQNTFTRIYPLYVRIVTKFGVMPMSGLRGNVFLNIPGINALFKDYNVAQDVCSIVDVFDYLLSNYMDSTSHLPDCLLEHKVHREFATLFPIKDCIGTLMLEGGEYSRTQLRDQVNFSCVWKGEIPLEVLTILGCRCVRQLLPLVDPVSCQLDLGSVLVNEVKNDFSLYYEWIHKTDDVCPRYFNSDPDRTMPHLLYQHALSSSPDFCAIGGADILDPMYGNSFDGSFNIGKTATMTDTVSAWLVRDIYQIITLSHMTHPGKRVKIVGSYMEDIWVWSTDSELVCYIDLVWWILASGGGLINSNQIYVY